MCGYRCLLSLPAPPVWRTQVFQQTGTLIESLSIEDKQLCSSLPGVPSCSFDHPVLSALPLPSPLTPETLTSLTVRSLCPQTLAPVPLVNNEEISDDASIVWQRRQYFETHLAAFLEKDSAYHSNLRVAGGDSSNRRKARVLSVGGCYRVVASDELDMWHSYLDYESAALLSTTRASGDLQATDAKSQGEQQEWEHCTYRGDCVTSARRSLTRLYERAVAADACMLYPEMWRRYAMWLLHQSGRSAAEGYQASLQLLRGALACEPLARCLSLRLLYADLLECSGHVSAAREVHQQLLAFSHVSIAPSSSSGDASSRKRLLVEGEQVVTCDLDVISLAVSFECRHGQFDIARSLLDKARSSCDEKEGARVRPALLLLQSQVLQAQQSVEGRGWDTPAVLQQLSSVCSANWDSNSCKQLPLSSLDLSSVLRSENELPLVKAAYALLLQLPPSADRDAKVWELLSNALNAAVYGVVPPALMSDVVEEGEVVPTSGVVGSAAHSTVPVSVVPGALCPALVLLLREYSRGPLGAYSISFSLQAETLVCTCMSHLRQQRLHQWHQAAVGHSQY